MSNTNPFSRFIGQSSASIAWGIIVALFLVGVIIFLSLYNRRRVRNLKTEIAHVQYIADPSSQPDRHHFDNPVYAFQPSTSHSLNDSSTLLNITTMQKPSNFSRGNDLEHMHCIARIYYLNFPIIKIKIHFQLFQLVPIQSTITQICWRRTSMRI